MIRHRFTEDTENCVFQYNKENKCGANATGQGETRLMNCRGRPLCLPLYYGTGNKYPGNHRGLPLQVFGKYMDQNIQKNRKNALIKAVIFICFIALCILILRFTSVKDYIDLQTLSSFINSAGIWAPVVYIIIYAVGVCIFIPGTLLTGIGAAVFGPYFGFIYVWTGAMIGSGFAFFIGRTLGRDYAASLIGEKLKNYDNAIERNGFATVLYLRLVYFPFTLMNFGMGLTKVRFTDYFFGTGLGIIVGTFIFTFFIGTLKDVWVSGNWEELISIRVFGSITLFIFSFFIPKIIKGIKKEA